VHEPKTDTLQSLAQWFPIPDLTQTKLLRHSVVSLQVSPWRDLPSVTQIVA
jgi:hypothetical protein